MALFEEALAGMRKGEKWRRASWVNTDAILMEGLARGGVPGSWILGDDWERVLEPRTFEEACERALSGVPQRRRNRAYCHLVGDKVNPGVINVGGGLIHIEDITATDWEDA